MIRRPVVVEDQDNALVNGVLSAMNSRRYCLAQDPCRPLQKVPRWGSQQQVVVEQRAHDIKLLRARGHETRLSE
eukprot:6241520-Pyramimonas_sp.AAC.1